MKKAPIIPLRRLWHYAHAHRPTIIRASISSVANKIFDLAPPALIGTGIDIVVQQENSFLAQLGIVNVSTQLWVLAGITILIWGIESLLDYTADLLWRNLAQAIQHDLRRHAYDHVQNLEMAYFEERSTGGLMAILNDDINQLERFLDGGAHDVIQLITTIIVINGLFFYAAPTVAWMSVIPMPIIMWGSIRFQKFLAPRYLAVRERVSLLNSQLANNLGGIATVKSFTAEAHELGRISKLSNDYQLSNQEAIKYSSAFVPLIRMVIVLGFIAILVFGGQLALQGQLNVGVYSFMVYMTQRLLWPLTRLGQTLDLYQRAMASTTRILDLLDTPPQPDKGTKRLPAGTVQGDLLFDQVTFAYGSHPEKAIVQGFSVHIPAGTVAAFVGATGAGKTTLIKLLLRFYELSSGRILLDGHDIRDLRLQDLRQAIGLVSQDVFLFHGSVRENITYGTFGATIEEIVQAAKMAEAHDFILQLPQGYETIVGERGIKLSGGQRQRISIARALLKNPPVLILDEATSSIDNETEAAIQRSLERIAVGRTTIVIAHRLSTVRNADQIFVLENGQLCELGKHEELLDNNGLYATLWQVQTGSNLAKHLHSNGQMVVKEEVI